MSHQPFDVEARWPELFDQLDTNQRQAVVRSLAAGWHEGWEPNREDVADLINYTLDALTFDEYKERSAAKAARITGMDTAQQPNATATRRPADSAAEAGIAHILRTPKDTAPGAAPDLSWIAEEHSRLPEG